MGPHSTYPSFMEKAKRNQRQSWVTWKFQKAMPFHANPTSSYGKTENAFEHGL